MDNKPGDPLEAELGRVSQLLEAFLAQHPAYRGECRIVGEGDGREIMVKAWMPAPQRTRRQTNVVHLGTIKEPLHVEILSPLSTEEVKPLSSFVANSAGGLMTRRSFTQQTGLIIHMMRPRYTG